MERRFGHDFSRVRLHTDLKAGDSAARVHALAYTAGQHIIFGHGQFAPATVAGRHLLAHELVHTLQQSGTSHEGAPYETRPHPASSPPPVLLQRRCADHANRDYYEGATNYCRDTPTTGQLHPGQTCFREVPRRTSYWDCPPGDQVCFDVGGNCHDSWDEASPVESKEEDGTCNLHFGCSMAHAYKDKVIQTWLNQQMEQVGRKQLECAELCEAQPWYLRGFCLQGCSGQPM
jgi:hypothetical protein